MEIIKLIAPYLLTFIFGGLAAQLVAEYFRRRGARIQTLTLIERVNRQVTPELRGITLARVTPTDGGRRLEEVVDLREYQLTLRNTTSIHLQNAEIQFEFPAKDVEAFASRPARSQTALEPADASPTEPWKRAFRWRIPHLPASDSVEFTFQALAPSSDQYVAALYNAERAVISKVAGEPSAASSVNVLLNWTRWVFVAAVAVFMPFIIDAIAERRWPPWSTQDSSERRFERQIGGAGCSLLTHVVATPRRQSKLVKTWFIEYRILNMNDRACTVSWPDASARKQTIDPRNEELIGMHILVGDIAVAKTSLAFSSGAEAPITSEIDTFVVK